MMRDQRGHLLWLGCICTSSALVYLRVLDGPFVFDDLPNITGNLAVQPQRLDLESLASAIWDSPNRSRPIANLSFAWNFAVAGLDARSFRIVNVGIHAISGMLVYAIGWLTLARFGQHLSASRRAQLAGLAALLFTLHPLQTQSVSYVVQRMTSLAGAFYLGGLVCFIRARSKHVADRARLGWWAACGLLGALAMGCKQNAATFPLALALYEALLLKPRPDGFPSRRHVIAGGVACFALLVVVGAITHPNLLAGYENRDFSLVERQWTELRVVVLYLSLVLLPLPSLQNLSHSVEISHSLLDPPATLFAALLIAGLLVAGGWLARRRPLLSFGILWFFLHLVIESSLLPLELVFEHRLYLPLLGVAIAALDPLLALSSRWPRPTLAAAGLVCVLLGAGSAVRNEAWTSAIGLWTDVVEKSPRDARAHSNLGAAYEASGEPALALPHVREATRLDPDYQRGVYNHGVVLQALGRPREAIPHLRRAVLLDATHAEAQGNLGAALHGIGELDEALVALREAVRLAPERVSAKSQHRIGSILRIQGRSEPALTAFRLALAEDPTNAKALHEMGAVLAQSGRLHEARASLATAIAVDPNNARAHADLGVVLAALGQRDAAIAELTRALRLEPAFEQARRHLMTLRVAAAPGVVELVETEQ